MHPFRVDELLELRPDGFLDRITMLGMCLISSGLVRRTGEDALREMTAATPLASTMARRLAAYLGCAPERDALGAARRRRLQRRSGRLPARALGRRRARRSGLRRGLPAADDPARRLRRADGPHGAPRVPDRAGDRRDARDGAASYDEPEDALAAACEAAAREGAVAFKSVLAYRTGLDVQPVSASDARAAFERWRGDGWRESREHAKPVRDRLLHRVMEVARAADLPVHIHCGGGDAEIVLGYARPQDLVPFLTAHLDQPVVLIHAGQPWLAEGAYVASILTHVYLELSITLPWASLAADQLVELLLGVAPTSKVLYGSDEASEPEVLWLSAQIGREVLGRVLGRALDHGWVDAWPRRSGIGAGVLAGNVLALHGLGGAR